MLAPSRVARGLRSRVGIVALSMCAVALCSLRAGAQLVVGNEPTTGQEITVIDLSGAQSPRVLVSGIDCWALAADNNNNVLYWATGTGLWKANYAPTGMLTPVQVGTMTQAMTGMAYDSVDNVLIGRASGGFYSIDVTTAATTLVFAITAQDFGGLDFDSATNAFYGVNDSTTATVLPNGRGIYRINKPLSAATFTFLSAYPNADTDIDGLAAGNGRLYLINDGSNSVAGEPIVYVYNLATNAFETSPTFSFTNNASSIFSGGAWAPALVAFPAGTDLAAAMSSPAACAVSAGGTLSFGVTISNFGNDISGPVTLTVDLPPAATATFLNSTPAPTTLTSTQAIYSLSPVAGAGGTALVTVNLTAVGVGDTASVTATATTTSDINNANNAATGSSRIAPVAPTTAKVKGIFSTNTALANSLIPGGGGRFTAFDRPYASSSGNWWTIRTDSDLPTASDSLLIRVPTGGAPTIALQEGVTTTSNGVLGIYDAGVKINNSGVIAFSGDDAGATTSDEFVATTDGTTVTDVAREGQPMAAIAGVNYGTSSGNAQIFNDGRVGFSFLSTPTGSTGYFTDNSATGLLVRLNVTQPTGASNTIDTMVTNTLNSGGVLFDASGAHSIYQADINTGLTTNDQVIVADGTVIMQEGVTVLPGLSSTVNGTAKLFHMGPGGTWLVRGSNATATEDWVVRGSGSTIDQVYKVGDPIHVGATDVWAEDASFTATYFSLAADAAGNFIIGGLTSASSDFSDAVLVYNNKVVVARENDPVDLNGDGVFNDGVYIRTFGDDDIAFTNDGAIVFTVSLRDEGGALCGLNNTDRGQAVVRIALPFGACCTGSSCASTLQVDCAAAFQGVGTVCSPSPCSAPAGVCCRGATCTTTIASSAACTGSLIGGQTAGANFPAGAGCNAPATTNTPCCYADYNKAGGITVNDIFDFLSDWFAGSPFANTGGNGSPAPLAVQNIFDFLSAWFAGGC